MANQVGDQLILERMTRLEDQLIENSDALDVKMSYVLIAVVFLAQLAISLYAAHLNHCQAIMVAVASGLATICGFYVYRGLTLAKFVTEDESYLEATRDLHVLQARAAEPDITTDELEAGFRSGIIDGAKQRMAENLIIVKQKVRTLRRAYQFCLLSGLLYVSVVLWLIIARL
jgi:fructose/tagatose bisphosphate aldolase